MTIVRQLLEGRGMTIGENGSVSLTRRYLVVGPTDETDVPTAEDSETGLRVPARLSPHPTNSYLTVQVVDPRSLNAFDQWHVDVTWTTPSGFTFEEDPLQKDPEWEWQFGTTAEMVDTDANGAPILNSAGDPFANDSVREVLSASLRVYVNELVFDPLVAKAIIGRVNSHPIMLFNRYFVGSEAMFCRAVNPQGRQTFDDRYVSLVYEFHFRDGNTPPAGSTNNPSDPTSYLGPWQERRIDKGNSGWYSDGGSKRDAFYSFGAGDPRADVLLDGTGKPIDSLIKVGRRLAGPIANPSVPTNFKIESQTNAKVLVFRRYKAADFRGLIRRVM